MGRERATVKDLSGSEKDHTAKDFPLTMENLTARRFYVSEPLELRNWFMQFQPNGTYEVGLGTIGGGWHDSGRYSIQGDRVELKPEQCSHVELPKTVTDNECDHSLGHAFCSIRATPDSLYYANSLECTLKKTKEPYLQ